MPKYTTKQFIEKAKAKHGDKYDYSSTVYSGSAKKVTINCQAHGPFEQEASSHLTGSGCRQCSHSSSSAKQCMTTETFVQRAREIHGEHYCYDKTKYVHSRQKLTFTCTIHQFDIFIEPYRHLQGNGCTTCSKELGRIVDTQTFVARAQTMYKDEGYDYSKVIYGDVHTSVLLTCPSHGDFLVKPVHHIHHRVKCYKCTELVTGGKKWLGNEGFIERAKMLHGDLYDYSRVQYTNIDSAVVIGCPEHGFFSQIAWKHIGEGKGCCKCNRPRFTLEQWVARAQDVHKERDFDYSHVTYRGAHEDVEIVCQQHGPWQIKAHVHLAGQGCPGCARYGYSKVALEWLEYRMVADGCHIQHAANGGEFRIPNSQYHADGYCAASNTIYELHGTFWHAHPDFYNPESIHPVSLRPCGEIYRKTLDREAFIRAQGFTLVVIWEFEWKLVRLAVKKMQHAWKCHKRMTSRMKNITLE